MPKTPYGHGSLFIYIYGAKKTTKTALCVNMARGSEPFHHWSGGSPHVAGGLKEPSDSIPHPANESLILARLCLPPAPDVTIQVGAVQTAGNHCDDDPAEVEPEDAGKEQGGPNDLLGKEPNPEEVDL